MVPGQLFLLPQYEIIRELGLLGTIPGIALPGLFSVFGTFLLRQFFQTLPMELEEAARLDGANEWQIFWRVMLPLAKPGIIALTLLTALWSWNDFLWPLVVYGNVNSMPLSVGLSLLTDLRLRDDALLMAGALLSSLPMIVVFLILQRAVHPGHRLHRNERVTTEWATHGCRSASSGSECARSSREELADREDVEIRVICDPSERARARALEQFPEALVTGYLDELLEAGIEAVFVLSPDDTHADIVCRCLAAGVAVFCEKPLAITIEDAIACWNCPCHRHPALPRPQHAAHARRRG